MQNLWLVFTTGLLTGGLTCLAVQGGLLATTIAQRQALTGPDKKGGVTAVFFFLMAKLFAYTVLGTLLGGLGGVLQPSLTAKALMQAGIAIFMVGTALGLIDVHPIFRYFIIQPPKFLTRIVRGESKSKDRFAPVLLGLMTIFIPCGTTQAMMALSIGSGNPAAGGAIMAAFVLGTSPLFFLFGFVATTAKDIFSKYFRPVAAATLVLVAAYSFNGSLALLGSSFTFENVVRSAYCTVTFCQGPVLGVNSAVNAAPDNTVNLTIGPGGYSVDNPVVKAGQTVTLNLVNRGGQGCIQAFTIPKLGIQRIVPPGNSDTVKFTAPKEPGILTFMCSMGMYRGNLQVI